MDFSALNIFVCFYFICLITYKFYLLLKAYVPQKTIFCFYANTKNIFLMKAMIYSLCKNVERNVNFLKQFFFSETTKLTAFRILFLFCGDNLIIYIRTFFSSFSFDFSRQLSQVILHSICFEQKKRFFSSGFLFSFLMSSQHVFKGIILCHQSCYYDYLIGLSKQSNI